MKYLCFPPGIRNVPIGNKQRIRAPYFSKTKMFYALLSVRDVKLMKSINIWTYARTCEFSHQSYLSFCHKITFSVESFWPGFLDRLWINNGSSGWFTRIVFIDITRLFFYTAILPQSQQRKALVYDMTFWKDLKTKLGRKFVQLASFSSKVKPEAVFRKRTKRYHGDKLFLWIV